MVYGSGAAYYIQGRTRVSSVARQLDNGGMCLKCLGAERGLFTIWPHWAWYGKLRCVSRRGPIVDDPSASLSLSAKDQATGTLHQGHARQPASLRTANFTRAHRERRPTAISLSCTHSRCISHPSAVPDCCHTALPSLAIALAANRVCAVDADANRFYLSGSEASQQFATSPSCYYQGRSSAF